MARRGRGVAGALRYTPSCHATQSRPTPAAARHAPTPATHICYGVAGVGAGRCAAGALLAWRDSKVNVLAKLLVAKSSKSFSP